MIRPSSKLALYIAALIAIYLIRDPLLAIAFGVCCIAVALIAIVRAPRPVPRGRWRAAAVFIVWVFLMRAGLDLVTGVPITDSNMWLVAGRQAMRVAVLAVGVIALIAVTRPRDIVEELEASRLPRWLRVLVMMLVQYPRVLRDRYEQIVEAQIARGGERPRNIGQRVAHGASLLLPVMQSELNAIGERATLMHLRGLDQVLPVGSPIFSPSRPPALAFRDVGFTYSGATKPSLSAVTLEIPAGRIVSVIAPQGGGKTTFLRAAAGLFETMDERGVLTGAIRRLGVPGSFFDGYVQVTLAVETVLEEIALPLHDKGIEPVEAVARELGIAYLLERDVTALSGGEEKLVGIAAALVVDSSLYVLDEPFEQLDVQHYSAVIRALKNRARAGALVLVSCESVDTALNISDSGLVFDGAMWRLIDQPTYADVAGIPGLASSSLGQFVARRGASLAGIRRFRDAVAL